MKFLALSFILCASVNGFIAPNTPRTSFVLKGSRADSSEAISAALEASKKFGATSKEAKLAWEIVEDIDASDDRCVYILSPSLQLILVLDDVFSLQKRNGQKQVFQIPTAAK